MENRYLFRAKRIDNGEWVEGFYFCMTHTDGRHTHHFIIPLGADLSLGTPIEKIQVEVDSSTVCQCTGLHDKNGKLIWENDIVFVTDDDGCSGQMDTRVGEISFIEGLWYIGGGVQNGLYDIDKCFQIEVVGSAIDDNPELLEGNHE